MLARSSKVRLEVVVFVGDRVAHEESTKMNARNFGPKVVPPTRGCRLLVQLDELEGPRRPTRSLAGCFAGWKPLRGHSPGFSPKEHRAHPAVLERRSHHVETSR